MISGHTTMPLSKGDTAGTTDLNDTILMIGLRIIVGGMVGSGCVGWMRNGEKGWG